MKNNFAIWRAWLIALMSVVLTGMLSLHAYIGTFSRFIADDYCSVAIVQRLGVLRATWFWYLNWTGRYSASATDSVSGLLGPGATSYYPLLILLMWLGIILLSIRSTIKFATQPALLTAWCGVVILGSTIIDAPTVVQSLYWAQGMRSVLPPLLLGTAFIPVFQIIKARSWQAGYKVFWAFLSFFIALAAGGYSETYSALQLVMFALAIFFYFVLSGKASIKRFEFYSLFFALFGSLVSLLLVISAPGNAVRQGFSPPPPDVLNITRISFQGFWGFLTFAFSSFEKTFALIGVIFCSVYVGMITSIKMDLKLGYIPLVFLTGLGVCFVCFPPAAYGLSEMPPDRTLIIPTYLMILTLFFTGFLAGQYVSLKLFWQKKASVLLMCATFFVCISAFLNMYAVSQSLPAFMRYAVYWDATHQQILDAKLAGVSDITIHSERNWAGLNDPGDNPKFWVNICMSEYYGVNILADNTGMQPGIFIP